MRCLFPLTMLICVGCGTSAPPQQMTESAGPAEVATAEFTASGHTTDSLSVVKERVAADEAVLIDVREQAEWDAGHLNSATLIPMSVLKESGVSEEIIQSLPAEKPIYLHCKSGGRAVKVAEILRAEGLDVRPLKAGYDELVEQGFQ